MKYKYIDHRDKFLNKVISLGDSNSSTLGHFPKKAFYAVAKKKWILICYEGDRLFGYLMFRIVQKSNSLSITHLCVSKNVRGKGVSDYLVDKLLIKYKPHVRGFSLNCRDDYSNAKVLWRRLGFKPILSKKGRGVKDTNLTLWWLDFNSPSLFTENYDSQKLKVLLDANVIIDLSDSNEKKSFVKSLLSDWLSDDVDFYFANEVYLDIDSDQNTERKEKTRGFLKRNFTRSTYKLEDFGEALSFLSSIKECKNDNDESDLKQIAEAIASGCHYFLTQDTDLLKLKDDVFQRYGIYIMSPEEFLIDIDSVSNTIDYQPARLAGTDYYFGKVYSSELETVTNSFLDNANGERKSQFKETISKLVTDVNAQLLVVKNKEAFFGLLGTRNRKNNSFIDVIRCGNHYLSDTLFQQLISYSINAAISDRKESLCISEANLTENQKSILRSFRFHNTDGNWIRYLVCGIYDDYSLLRLIDERDIEVDKELFEGVDSFKPGIERVLFPLKLSGHDINCFIVPIKPYWATQLFDHISAKSSLFGAKPELSWNRENVYYRSSRPKIISEIGRILWYISEDERAPRKKCIVASSYIENVEIDEASLLYKRNKRLGIYEWRDIEKLTNGNPKKEIMAIRFSDTELFSTEVDLKVVQDILYETSKKKYTFQSPVRISNDIFTEIYDLGFQKAMKKYE